MCNCQCRATASKLRGNPSSLRRDDGPLGALRVPSCPFVESKTTDTHPSPARMTILYHNICRARVSGSNGSPGPSNKPVLSRRQI